MTAGSAASMPIARTGGGRSADTGELLEVHPATPAVGAAELVGQLLERHATRLDVGVGRGGHDNDHGDNIDSRVEVHGTDQIKGRRSRQLGHPLAPAPTEADDDGAMGHSTMLS